MEQDVDKSVLSETDPKPTLATFHSFALAWIEAAS